jgi:demethylsterigmatocystin 6-O-methyltransferase
VRASCNLGIFKALAASDTPLSVEKLGEASGADPVLLGRIMRYLASVRRVTETSKDHFTGNSATKTLADPGIEGSISYT